MDQRRRADDARRDAQLRHERERDEMQVRDSNGWAEWIPKQDDGIIDLTDMDISNKVMARFAEGLAMAFEANPKLELTEMVLDANAFGDEGLSSLANVFGRFPRCRETLETLSLRSNRKITTIKPLADAGTFEAITTLAVGSCGLRDVLPQLDMTQLERFDVSDNTSIIIPEQVLRALPKDCKVLLSNIRYVSVFLPHAPTSGKMEDHRWTVDLPNEFGELFGGVSFATAKTVRDICEHAGVNCHTMVKPARTMLRCETCLAPRPAYMCGDCKQKVYCGKACQEKHWSSHLPFCKLK